MYNDSSKANQTNIQQTAYWMLEQLISIGTNEIVKKACLMKKNIAKPIYLTTIFTSDIARFSKGCLILNSDPLSTAYQVYQANFDKFLTDKSDLNIFQQIRLDSIYRNTNGIKSITSESVETLKSIMADKIDAAYAGLIHYVYYAWAKKLGIVLKPDVFFYTMHEILKRPNAYREFFTKLSGKEDIKIQYLTVESLTDMLGKKIPNKQFFHITTETNFTTASEHFKLLLGITLT